MQNVLIVGAGLSGAVVGRCLAEAGRKVTIIDERGHAAGNCHTERDAATGIMRHCYGAHIFHTGNNRVWDFVNRFMAFKPYIHRVKTTSGGRVYSLPLNLHTLNQFFAKAMNPEEARAFMASLADTSLVEPRNFEEQALSLMGEALYQAFFYGYTRKQWGVEPRDLPASILQRLPVRFNYDDNYFNHPYQGIPEQGYTLMVENILDHPHIEVRLNTVYDPGMREQGDYLFYSGPLDRYFDYQLGRLPYRSLDFEWFRAEGDWQGCAVMNYADPHVPYTRIVEHKHFAWWEQHESTVCFREVSKPCGPDDVPYYPVRFADDNPLLERYLQLAASERNIRFIGRLGMFRYCDMDVAIQHAFNAADEFLSA